MDQSIMVWHTYDHDNLPENCTLMGTNFIPGWVVAQMYEITELSIYKWRVRKVDPVPFYLLAWNYRPVVSFREKEVVNWAQRNGRTPVWTAQEVLAANFGDIAALVNK